MHMIRCLLALQPRTHFSASGESWSPKTAGSEHASKRCCKEKVAEGGAKPQRILARDAWPGTIALLATVQTPCS